MGVRWGCLTSTDRGARGRDVTKLRAHELGYTLARAGARGIGQARGWG